MTCRCGRAEGRAGAAAAGAAGRGAGTPPANGAQRPGNARGRGVLRAAPGQAPCPGAGTGRGWWADPEERDRKTAAGRRTCDRHGPGRAAAAHDGPGFPPRGKRRRPAMNDTSIGGIDPREFKSRFGGPRPEDVQDLSPPVHGRRRPRGKSIPGQYLDNSWTSPSRISMAVRARERVRQLGRACQRPGR